MKITLSAAIPVLLSFYIKVQAVDSPHQVPLGGSHIVRFFEARILKGFETICIINI
jgi:hypothetical protein